MKKVGFFKSIQWKFILIYVLLILVAMQVIGVYFVRQLEQQLVTNFSESLDKRVHLLAYNIEQAMLKSRDESTTSLESDLNAILQDFVSEDIKEEAQVIDNKSRVIAVSSPSNKVVIGKRTTQISVKRTLVVGTKYGRDAIDPKTGHRMRVMTIPVKSGRETIAAIYLEASMEKVYEQMREINNILAAGTVIALAITAGLGIYLARTITRPMADMRKQALVMAKGDFSRKVQVYGNDEIGQLAMAFNNLTDRLEEAQATTEGERRKLSSVLAHMTDGVIATDRYGRVILMNDPAERMLNVSRETLLESSILKVLRLDDEMVTWASLFEETDSLLLDYSSNDKKLILKANFSIVQNDDGKANGLITVLHDVTEQEQIEQERREFVVNVSHELRTPLTTMKSYLEALTDGAWKDEEIAPKFLNVTQNETERMIRLVTDLLQLSKLDSKDYALNANQIDFVEFFNKIIDRFEMTKKEQISFLRCLPKKEYLVKIDQDKITQVLDNIISNALKYSPEGGSVQFGIVNLGNKIKVSIADKGVGIPKENVAKIFDRFYRVDKARSRKLGGTGLGLAIAKEMVQVHGGDIWAESEEGNGTTIFFTLPIQQDSEVEVL